MKVTGARNWQFYIQFRKGLFKKVEFEQRISQVINRAGGCRKSASGSSRANMKEMVWCVLTTGTRSIYRIEKRKSG